MFSRLCRVFLCMRLRVFLKALAQLTQAGTRIVVHLTEIDWFFFLSFAALMIRHSQRCHRTEQGIEHSNLEKRSEWFCVLETDLIFKSPHLKTCSAVLESWMLLICRKLHWLPTAGSCCSLCDTGFVWQLQSFLFQHYRQEKKEACIWDLPERFFSTKTTKRQKGRK